MVTELCPSRVRVPSQEPKKNVLSFLTGPPKVAPYWFCLYGGFLDPLRLAKKFVPSKFELRRNSNTEPCNWLVPDLMLTNTCPPMRVPYSAERLLVTTRNSPTASTLGLTAWASKPIGPPE